MKQKVLLISIAAICILFLALLGICAIVSATPKTTQIDWQIADGFLLDADGQIIETAAVTIRGEIRDYRDREDSLTLSFDFPETFPYITDFQDPPVYADFYSSLLSWPYHFSYGFCLLKETGAMCAFSFAIDPDEGLLVMRFDNKPEHFFVASLDASSASEDILQHFENFLGSQMPLLVQ